MIETSKFDYNLSILSCVELYIYNIRYNLKLKFSFEWWTLFEVVEVLYLIKIITKTTPNVVGYRLLATSINVNTTVSDEQCQIVCQNELIENLVLSLCEVSKVQ